jgi:anti-anti-sigma regulatory factor
MTKKNEKNSYFLVQEESENYAHIILANIFSEPKVTAEIFEISTQMILEKNKNIVIDLRDNVYVGKSMLAFLINLDCHLREKNQSLILMSLRNRVHALLEWFNLENTIKHIRSVDQIPVAFNNPS